MLLETLLGVKEFLCLVYFGICAGLVFSALHIFNFKNKWLNLIPDFLSVLLMGFIFIFAINKYCFGQIRFFFILGFLIGFILTYKTICKFVDLFFNMVYNICVKLFKRIISLKVVVLIKNKLKKITSFLKIKKVNKKQNKKTQNKNVKHSIFRLFKKKERKA